MTTTTAARRRRTETALAVLAALGTLVITGCVDTTADPSQDSFLPPIENDASGDPEPTALGITDPPRIDGEVARAVFLSSGADGVPESSSTIFGVPAGADAVYLLDAVCVPIAEPVPVGYRIMTADDLQVEVQSGTLLCDGSAIVNSSQLGTDAPVQIHFTSTDGVQQANARLVPAV